MVASKSVVEGKIKSKQRTSRWGDFGDPKVSGLGGDASGSVDLHSTKYYIEHRENRWCIEWFCSELVFRCDYTGKL